MNDHESRYASKLHGKDPYGFLSIPSDAIPLL
jgi:hypothetical protein